MRGDILTACRMRGEILTSDMRRRSDILTTPGTPVAAIAIS